MFLGDIGGVIEFFVFTSNILMKPIAEYSFILKMLEKLFIAKTNDSDLFKNDQERDAKSQLIEEVEEGQTIEGLWVTEWIADQKDWERD